MALHRTEGAGGRSGGGLAESIDLFSHNLSSKRSAPAAEKSEEADGSEECGTGLGDGVNE